MKSITLHAPAIDNDGNFRDAGADIDVGDKGDMIDAQRAGQLVRNMLATGAVEATNKAAAKS